MWTGIRFRIVLYTGSDPTEERVDGVALLARVVGSVRAKKGLGGGKDKAMADPRFSRTGTTRTICFAAGQWRMPS